MMGTRINPLLTVKDIEKSVDFYEGQLGFKKNTVLKNDDGSLRYVDFIVGTSVIMLVPQNSRADDVQQSYKTNQLGVGVELYIDIDEDIKTLFENLKAKGLSFIKDLYVTPWHTYQFHFKDPDGYIFIVSQLATTLS